MSLLCTEVNNCIAKNHTATEANWGARSDKVPATPHSDHLPVTQQALAGPCCALGVQHSPSLVRYERAGEDLALCL